MGLLAKIYSKITAMLKRNLSEKRQIKSEEQNSEIQKVNDLLYTKVEEIEAKKKLLERYWNTLIDISKSQEINFGTIETALSHVAVVTANTLGVTRVSVWQYYPDKAERIKCIAAFNRSNNEHFKQDPLFLQDNERYFHAIKKERVIAADDALEHPDTFSFALKYLEPLQIRSMMDIPFFLDGKLAGVLCCEHQVDYRHWSGEDIIFATSMAEIVSLAFRSVARSGYERELEAFSYSVAHDLRAPIRVISGYTEILLSEYGGNLETECLHMLKKIDSNTRQMAALIDVLLEFSRLNKLPVKKCTTDMANLVKSVIDEQLPFANRNQVEFIIGNIQNLHCDTSLMRQVLTNLISNSIKYSRKKEKPIVEIDSYSRGNDTIFSIKDNGTGFDMKYAEKLFEVFQRLHTASDFEGTGVGLALVHRIITKHGGSVWAESELGKGATFYFSLPMN